MSRDVITVGSTIRIPLLYRGEYSQWRERIMNNHEEQTDGEAMINSIQNGDQPLPVIAQVSLAGNAQNAPPTLKDPKFWTAEEKKTRKIDRLAKSLLIQGLPNDIYSHIDSNETAKDLWDALERQMRGSEYGEQDRKAKDVVVTSDPLALVAEKTKVCKRKEKVVVSSDSEGSGADDFSELKKITALLAKAFNRRKFYSKPTNNNLRTSSTSQSANKKQEFVKSNDKKKDKKADDKKRDMSKVKYYNCKKEGHFAKDSKKAKIKDYNYYKTKMLLVKKDSDEQVLLAEDQAWMESSSDSDQEIKQTWSSWHKLKRFFQDQTKVLHLLKKPLLRKGIGFENLRYFEKAKDLRHSLYDEKVIAPGMFKLSVSQSVSPISMSETSCDSKNVETKLKRKRHLDTFSSVRRPKHSGVIWKKKGLSNTSNVDLSSVSHSRLNKDVKRHSHKDLLSCNNSHLRETSSAYMCNDAMNVYCNSRMCDLFDDNNFFIFDDESVRISPVSKMPFRKKPRDSINIVQICLWIIDSGCSKHMTGNRALLTNIVEKFLGTVCFGNNNFMVIAGYGDVVIGSMTIKKVYYVEGLGNNLFSVGQFCNKGLEVAFRKSTCFVRNKDGVNLLTGDRSSNLYTIALNEVASNSLTYLLAKASSSQSWLWH
uniref:Integrase, catalytic region, zinc finger, CCHC-type, peptidase aspartic, catalytic n=1 Tax=Tanacetum cinerariifolium TaxID=118510 RepID=A0A6L2L0I5_TANCI|nr:integrase, catalytic region, zinc finger, CCHC-type, peptidase aspartic, catalytic [Tanacetum cinerariifolium]